MRWPYWDATRHCKSPVFTAAIPSYWLASNHFKSAWSARLAARIGWRLPLCDHYATCEQESICAQIAANMSILPLTLVHLFSSLKLRWSVSALSNIMALRLFLLPLLLHWSFTALAYPGTKYLGTKYIGTKYLGTKYLGEKFLGEAQRIYPRKSPSLAQEISPSNNTSTPPLSPPIGAIECFQSEHGRQPTDVNGCRPTLNYIRSFPNYRLIQDFMEDRYPKLPSKPPYAVHHVHSNCAVQIASGSPYTIDDFSFEQARALATEILELCLDHGGHGGFAPIGHGVGWRVAVIGWKLPPDPPDRIGPLEEEISNNETLVPINIVKAWALTSVLMIEVGRGLGFT